jgi:protease-4
MKRVLGVLALVLLAGLMAYFAAARGESTVQDNSTLYLRLHAPLSELHQSSLLAPLVGETPTLRETVAQLRRARTDRRVKGLVIMPDTDGAMWAQVQELRAAVAEVRAAGKSVTAYLESGGAPAYYVASAADRILMMPGGSLDLSGLATYELFFRGTLDKLGVFPDLLHIGDYKTAANTFTEKSMTPAHREMNASLNRDMYNELVRAIAEGRKRTEAEIRTAIDAGPFLADDARRAGLIDALAYEDQIDDAPPVAGTRRLEGDRYAIDDGGHFSFAPSPRIALLYAAGEIASARSSFDGASGLIVGSETFAEWIRTARADASVRAIVIRVDSPGGSAIASEVIWRELMLTRDVKPLVVSMGDVAASGGYFIALPAHEILAQPGTLTGSIGVVTGKFVLGGALDKIGVGTGVVSDGALAELASPLRPFTAAERAKMQAQMQVTYEGFVDKVAAARKTTREKVLAVAEGRVWTGRQAKDLGLVDRLGGLTDAIRIAKERAKISASATVVLDVYPEKRGWLETLSNPLGAGLGASAPLSGVVSRLKWFRRFRPGETLMLMPNVFVR